MSEYVAVRPEWLERHVEAAIEPDLPIVDAHHHLWDISGWEYMLPDYLADLRSGHNVKASVFAQCYSMFRASGPRELRSLGETEFANGAAAMASSGIYGDVRICDGIVGYVNLLFGRGIGAVLEKHVAAAGGRFKGIRYITSWSDDKEVHPSAKGPPPHLLLDATFQEGFSCLEPLGLSFDAMIFHTQLDELAELAGKFPGTRIILDHIGMPLGIGRYRDQREQVRAEWVGGMKRLAEYHNVCVKLGGMAMKIAGFDFHQHDTPPNSTQLADAWRPYFEQVIEIFGPSRCMFESNFPVDKGGCSYAVLWNAYKRIIESYSANEKAAMLAGTAARIYDLSLDLGGE